MKDTVKFDNKSCLIFHSWEIVKDNGFTIYRKCKDCGCRKVTQPKNSVYQPIDWDWIAGKHESIQDT